MKGALDLAIIGTDQWLEKDWQQPEVLCERLRGHFPFGHESKIYQELVNFGMYRRRMYSQSEMDGFIKSDVWVKTSRLFTKYKAKWSGPDIPVFIFPAVRKIGFLRNAEPVKSGVSYTDKLFLFLPQEIAAEELEALFVHEYHHCCRLGARGKKAGENTLLDSMILEGLAEYAVFKECGERMLGKWCALYREDELRKFWKLLLRNNLDKKKTDKIHDLLLFGGKGVPPLLGYCYGFYLVKNYYKKNDFCMKKSFEISDKTFITLGLEDK